MGQYNGSLGCAESQALVFPGGSGGLIILMGDGTVHTPAQVLGPGQACPGPEECAAIISANPHPNWKSYDSLGVR